MIGLIIIETGQQLYIDILLLLRRRLLGVEHQAPFFVFGLLRKYQITKEVFRF